MKIWKLISLLLLTAFAGACDDNTVEDEGTGGIIGGSETAASFGYEAKSVLRNAGQLLVPVRLEQKVATAVKVTVAVKQGEADTDAREDIDFSLLNKVVTIPAGDTVGYLTVNLIDNQHASDNRTIALSIAGVYGGKVGARSSCSLYIVSNAFVEFEKAGWETYESASVEGSSEEIRNSRFVPLLITGEITQDAVIVLGVEDSTAVEPTHFSVEKEITVRPGDTRVMVEIKTVDDGEANDDRWFRLYIKAIRGGNLLAGEAVNSCHVKIISEEIKRMVSFDIVGMKVKDKEKNLKIPVLLDNPSVNDVVVTVGANMASTAVEGVDYEFVSKTVTIGSTTRTADVEVKILGDQIVNADRKLILEFKDATEQVTLSETVCPIDILNNDWDMSWDKAVFDAEEDTGVYMVKAHITPADRERIVKLTYETGNSAFFSNCPGEVKIPAGAETIDVSVTLGYDLTWPAKAPELKIMCTECDEKVNDVPLSTVVKLGQCAFRKLTGVWTMNTGNPDNCLAVTDATITLVTWQKEVKVVLTKFWGGNNVYFNMTFDEETQKLSIILDKRCVDGNFNFGAPDKNNVALRLLVDGQYTLTGVDMGGYDVEKGILTLPIDKHIGGGGSNGGTLTGNPTVWGFFFKNGTLVKK